MRRRVGISAEDQPGSPMRARPPMERPGHDEYFMAMARLANTRGTCFRRSVGAILVKDRHVLATGYNGNPKGLRHCDEIGCIRETSGVASGERHELCTGLHAEQNAIIQAAKFGICIDGSTLYCTHSPCSICAKMLINAGIREIVYEAGYPDELALSILGETTIVVRKLGSDGSDLPKVRPLPRLIAEAAEGKLPYVGPGGAPARTGGLPVVQRP